MDFSSLVSAILLSLVLLFFVIHFYFHSTERGRYCNKISGPKSYPIIGNILDIIVSPEEFWDFLRRSTRDYYPIWKVWLGIWPVVNIHHPDDVEVLLSSTKNIRKSLVYDVIRPWMQDGLLLSTGEKWRSRRKILTPAFHFNNLKEHLNFMIEHTDRVINEIKSGANDGVIKEVLPLLTTFTLKTICESTMGVPIKGSDDDEDNYKESVHRIGEIFLYRGTRPWLMNNWIFGLTSKGREQSRLLKYLHGFSNKIIKERISYHEKTGGKYLNDSSSAASNSNSQSDDGTKRRRLAFLDILIAASKRELGVDRKGISEEVDTFVFEGHDTTATVLVFAVLLLAEHKDIQNRARTEIEEVLKESNGKMSMEAIQRFTYLECCIKEALRLYPSVPLVSRHIEEDLQLKHSFVPKGTIVNVLVFDTHRDPNFWPRPNIFDPNRFFLGRPEDRHPYSYIPFSAGPRNCIGQKFAMLEMKTFLAGLLYNFYLEPQEATEAVRIYSDLVIRPSSPVYVKFVPIIR
ncbi:cytochrome P450 4C1 [Microplitis mediator]|uniref:cytochrome P450 4C1 n=1 Tax=Microplitis mediator TaxID=375433 RepID=UPI0025576CD6|nr:cytochrome P450 4C1 [Microplitis mediator]